MAHGYGYPSGPAQQPQAPWFLENGRYYGNYRKFQYLLPVDEGELDRLDIMHKFMTLIRSGDRNKSVLHQLPITEPRPKILDLGCGTGIWAIDMADRYRDGKIYGLDLNYTQPEKIPDTITFRQQDIEESQWGLEMDSFDLIHIQMLFGSIADWYAVYRNAFRHLKPGSGVIEHIEIDFRPYSADGSLPGDSYLVYWAKELRAAYAHHRRPLMFEPGPEALLKQAGFENVQCVTKPIPCHPWPPSEDEKEVGRWFNLGMTEGLASLTMAPLTRHRGFSKAQVEELVKNVSKDLCTMSMRSCMNLNIWTAVRPFPRRH